MKFRYDITDNYFQVFNESQGIVTFKSELEKNPYKVDTYLGKCFSYGKFVLISGIICFLLNLINSEWFISEISMFLFAILTAFEVGLLVVFFLSYFQNKKIFHSGEIKFDKNGILDTSDSGVRIGVDWGLVDLVVVKDKIIVLLTKTNFYFHFDEELIDKVLEAVNKYHKDVKILNVSLTRFKVDEVVKSEKIDEIKLNEPKEEVQEEIEEKVTEDVKELDLEEEDATEEIDTTKIEEIKVEEKEEDEVVEDVDDVIGYVVPEEDDRVLNPIAQEVSTMENHPIIKITIPPYDESEESTEEEEQILFIYTFVRYCVLI